MFWDILAIFLLHYEPKVKTVNKLKTVLTGYGRLPFSLNITLKYTLMGVFDLSYPAMSGPALIRIRDLAGYGRLNV